MNRKLVNIVFFLFFLSISCVWAADWASVVKKTGNAIAKIVVKDGNGAVVSQGSGFVIKTTSGQQRFVTNAHVVIEAEHSDDFSITAEFNYPFKTDEVFRLEIDVIDRNQDLCLLFIDSDAPGVLQLADGKKSSLMEEILVIGYPLGKSFKTTPGYLQAFQEVDGMGKMLDLSASAAPGSSGGPVLNSAGQVIGIVNSIIPGYNFNLAIPVENLSALMKKDDDQVKVDIRTEPSEAWVFIDGKYKGKSPITLSLFNRSHKLMIEKADFDKFEDKIGPWENDYESISIELEEEVNYDPVIEIITIPEGAEVAVNNNSLGPSPVSIQLPAGSIMRIRVSKWGYTEILEFYDVTEDSRQTVNIELKRSIFGF